LGDLDIDRRIILGWILREKDGKVWAGSIRFTIGNSGGLFLWVA
jgi:hypothetical protein